MAVKNITYPPPVVISGNEVLLQISVEDAYKNLGLDVKGHLYLVNYNHSPGDTISFSWTGNNVVFTCTDNYTGEPNTYPKRTTETMAEWGLKVFNCILSNDLLADDFIIRGYIVGGTYYITFEPYEKVASNNLTIEADTLASIDVGPSSFTPDELYEDFKLRVQLMQKIDDPDFEGYLKVRSAVYIPFIFDGLNAELTYDLSRLLYTDLTGHFTFPEDGIRHLHNILPKYYLQLSFVADNIVNETPEIEHFVHVVPGKMPDTKEKALNTIESSVYAELVSSKRFLSYAPDTKKTDIYSPEKLYFLFLSSITGAVLYITERFENDPPETRALLSFDASQYSLHEFSVGFQSIKQEDYGSKILTEYEIWIENGSGGLISERRTYQMDYTYQRMARYFWFKNSFGMYELFRTTGDAIKTNKISKEFYERVVHGKKDKDQSRKLKDLQHTYIMQVNTGYIEDPWNFYLAHEFLGADDVYWLKNDRAYAVQIEGKDVDLSKTDMDNLHEFDFIIVLDDMDDSFFEEFLPGSELPVQGDFNNDFGDDFYV